MTLEKIWTLEEEYFFIKKIFCDFGPSIFSSNKISDSNSLILKRKRFGYFNFLSNFFIDKKPTQVKSKLQKIIKKFEKTYQNKLVTESEYLQKYFKSNLIKILERVDINKLNSNLNIMYDEDFVILTNLQRNKRFRNSKEKSICSQLTDYDISHNTGSNEINDLFAKDILLKNETNIITNNININNTDPNNRTLEFNQALSKTIDHFKEFMNSFENIREIIKDDSNLVCMERKIIIHIKKINEIINKLLQTTPDDLILKKDLFKKLKFQFD